MTLSRPVVIFDACVLYPAPLRDLLMHIAMVDVFRACWSDLIHDEWIRNVLISRPDLTQVQLNGTRALMNQHARDSLVEGFEHLIDGIELPDPNDRHVVAAALHCGASVIVTFNLKDFPDHKLTTYSLMAVHPDELIHDYMETNLREILEAVKAHRNSLRNPAKSPDEYLQTLLEQGLTRSVDRLRSCSGSI